MKNYFQFDILPSGEIRFSRGSKEKNSELMTFFRQFGIDNVESLKEFFESGNSIEQLIGEEPLCG